MGIKDGRSRSHSPSLALYPPLSPHRRVDRGTRSSKRLPLRRDMPKIPILRRLTAPRALTINRFQPQPLLRRFTTRCHCVNDRRPPAAPLIKLRKKALIIGIQYLGTQGKLGNTHRDAKLWRDLLIRGYFRSLCMLCILCWVGSHWMIFLHLRQVWLRREGHRDDARRRCGSLVIPDKAQHRKLQRSQRRVDAVEGGPGHDSILTL